MRIDRFIRRIISDPKRSLKERVYLVLTMSGLVTGFIALLGDLIYHENIVEIIVIAGTIIGVPLLTFFGIRTGRVNLSIALICFGVVFILIPVIFFFGGGTQGAVVPWMLFAYLYFGLILSGRLRIVMLILHSVVVMGCFLLEYRYPELITLHSRGIRFVDTLLAVIEVGYVCFVMTWFQNLLNAQENRMAREETKKVEELSRSQNRFFSNMSHEIRTPINSILGLNEVILRDPDASDSIKKDAGNIQGAGRMLLSLINDILDFSKIEAGKMDIVPVNYSIADLISDVVNMIWLRAEEKGLRFNIELDPSLPSELYGDEMRIRQILVNLLNNAVKYTKEGSVTLHVEKETQEEDQIVILFSVSDTGMGIKQEVIPYLFDAFKRVDESNTAKIEGTGLGLSIVKQLVDLMGGRIAVDSIYTQGSNFTVTLRQRVTRADTIGIVDIGNYSKKQTGRDVRKASFTAKDARILIVDDSVMNLTVESKLLERTGITIDTAKSGEEALALTRTERYDVILMDHLMPEMDGIECLQHIRTQTAGLNNRVPIIVLTANADSENRQLYAQSGFDGYLVKPASGAQLEEMLLNHLPDSKVEYSDGRDAVMTGMNASRDYSRRIPVLVTCAGTCDLPVAVKKKYQFETIPYKVSSGGRTFYDGIEASGDELVRYVNEGVEFDCDPPSVDEFRTFFGKGLKYAHNLIYISGGAGIGPEYERACEAARSYDHVAVIDSQSCSATVGLLVLIAQKMSSRGATFERIVTEIETAKKRIRSGFVLDSIYFLRKIGRVNEGVASFLRALNVRLVVRYKKDLFGGDKLILGGFDRYYKKFIDHMIPAKSRPDRDIAMVVYASLSEEQKEKIETYIRSVCDFKRIIFQRASSVLPIFMGTDAFSLVFVEQGDSSYDLGEMFEEEEPEKGEESAENEEPEENEVSEENWEPEEAAAPEKAEQPSGKWYDDIRGIDPALGIENSQNEEIYRTVVLTFYGTIDSNMDEINGYYEEENWSDYTVKVHALKSTALLIGAKELSDEARALETAGKNGDIEYIRKNTSIVMEHLKSLKASLAKALADKEAD